MEYPIPMKVGIYYYYYYFVRSNLPDVIIIIFNKIIIRYLIALGFKLIGRCHTEQKAFEMSSYYKELINSFPLTQMQKEKLTSDLDNNWMCNECRMSFIDAGRLPRDHFEPNPMTTNNYTERINRTIESPLPGKQTVVMFIERLYGMKLLRENYYEEGTGQVTYES